MNGFTKTPVAVRLRAPNQFASTNITNELAEALAGGVNFGNAEDSPSPNRPLCIEITGEATDPGVYICDVYQLEAGYIPPGGPISIENMKGDAIITGAYFVNTGGGTNELATGTVIITLAFCAGPNPDDGKEILVGLGLALGGCS